MESYWGIDHGVEISKKKSKDYSGQAVGAGATVGGIGLVGGGIPIARPDSGRLHQAVNARSKAGATRHIVSAARGGVFGYREDAHRKYLNQMNQDLRGWRAEHKGKAFERGAMQGRVQAEKDVIRTMRKGRIASNVALGAGAALAAGGAYAHRQKVHKAKKNDRYGENTLIGAGGTAAAAGFGGGKLLENEAFKWNEKAKTHLSEAQKINPKMGGYDVHKPKPTIFRTKQKGVKHVNPQRSTQDIAWNHEDVFNGHSQDKATKAGKLRGMATQERYFSRVYGQNAKMARKVGKVGLGMAAAGLAGKAVDVKLTPESKRSLGHAKKAVSP
jgi:hypothetical protein